jgi:hypothetical protein
MSFVIVRRPQLAIAVHLILLISPSIHSASSISTLSVLFRADPVSKLTKVYAHNLFDVLPLRNSCINVGFT